MLLCIICQIATGSIAKVELNLPELEQGRVQIIFKQVALFAASLFSIFTTQNR